jgi:hypothetical protein
MPIYEKNDDYILAKLSRDDGWEPKPKTYDELHPGGNKADALCWAIAQEAWVNFESGKGWYATRFGGWNKIELTNNGNWYRLLNQAWDGWYDPEYATFIDLRTIPNK